MRSLLLAILFKFAISENTNIDVARQDCVATTVESHESRFAEISKTFERSNLTAIDQLHLWCCFVCIVVRDQSQLLYQSKTDTEMIKS